MKFWKLWDGIKLAVFGTLCLMISLFLYTIAHEIYSDNRRDAELNALPNHNYIPEIIELKDTGKFGEALELAQFVVKHNDMPGQDQAKELEAEIVKEMSSLHHRVRNAAQGFLIGGGNSIEEMVGSITADMIIYGDIRDLIKHGYYKITGNEEDFDPLIIALSGIGLVTELVDVLDWAPAVLKAFRRVGALSKKFTDFIITSAKKTAKTRKLDSSLKGVFKNLKSLSGKLGLARTSSLMKHVDTPADLAAITKVAQKNADAAYFTVKNGGTDGVKLLKNLGDSEKGVLLMTKAAKKGNAGITWLKSGNPGRKYLLQVRFSARIIKNLRMGHLQNLLKTMATQNKHVYHLLWTTIILTLLTAITLFIESSRRLLHPPSPNPTHH